VCVMTQKSALRTYFAAEVINHARAKDVPVFRSALQLRSLLTPSMKLGNFQVRNVNVQWFHSIHRGVTVYTKGSVEGLSVDIIQIPWISA
jgi:hypothetical protein